MSIGAWIGCGVVSVVVLAVIVAVFGQPPEPRPETPEERKARVDEATDALSQAWGLVDAREVLGGGESVSTQIAYSNAQRVRALDMEQGMKAYDYRRN